MDIQRLLLHFQRHCHDEGPNWHPLDQRRLDSHLTMLYKVKYDLAAIPTSQYLTRNTWLSRHIHPLSYRFPLLKTINGSNFSQGQLFIGMPGSPHTTPSHLGSVQQCCLVYKHILFQISIHINISLNIFYFMNMTMYSILSIQI